MKNSLTIKGYAVVGAYLNEGINGPGLVPTLEGIFANKADAKKKMKELLKDAKEAGLSEEMDSGIYDDEAEIYYEDGSYQTYKIEEIKF